VKVAGAHSRNCAANESKRAVAQVLQRWRSHPIEELQQAFTFQSAYRYGFGKESLLLRGHSRLPSSSARYVLAR